jgi:hypothetical protein
MHRPNSATKFFDGAASKPFESDRLYASTSYDEKVHGKYRSGLTPSYRFVHAIKPNQHKDPPLLQRALGYPLHSLSLCLPTRMLAMLGMSCKHSAGALMILPAIHSHWLTKIRVAFRHPAPWTPPMHWFGAMPLRLPIEIFKHSRSVVFLQQFHTLFEPS